MDFKNLFKVFKQEKSESKNNIKRNVRNIYKDEVIESVILNENNSKNLMEPIYIPSDFKTDEDASIIVVPISDYKYETEELTLYDQREFFKAEREKLDKISEGIEVYRRYYKKLSTLAPLINSIDFKNIPELEELSLDVIIQTLKSDLGILLSEYESAYKNAAKSSYGAKLGILGESAVDKELSLYKDKILNLSNIRLETEGTTVESDNIIISEKGIFLVEVKNYGAGHGGKLKISQDGLWTRHDNKGKEIEVEDITAQVYRHIGITQRFLNEQMKKNNINIPYIEIKPIIVIANKNIKIENESAIPILRISNIYHYISSYKSQHMLEENYWKSIELILNKSNKGAKSYTVPLCADKIKENYKAIYHKLKYFDSIDKQIDLTKLFESLCYKEHQELILSFQNFNRQHKKGEKKISHVEEVTLRALIDEKHKQSGADRGLYESLILKYFDITNINELSYEAYNYIYKCLNTQ